MAHSVPVSGTISQNHRFPQKRLAEEMSPSTKPLIPVFISELFNIPEPSDTHHLISM